LRRIANAEKLVETEILLHASRKEIQFGQRREEMVAC
jgi:hypothetical protein